MNQPVTHGECHARMEILEQKMHTCMKEDKTDFRDTITDVEEWVGKLESKMDYMIYGLLFLALEGFVGLIITILTLSGGF